MKPLKLSFLLILIGSALFLNGAGESTETPSTQQKQRAETKTSAQQHDSNPNPFESPIKQSPTKIAPESSTYNIQNYNYNPQDGGNLPAWLQAIGTIGLLIFAWWQMWFMRRATKATETAANAARDNAIAAKESAETSKTNVAISKVLADATVQSAHAAQRAAEAAQKSADVADTSLKLLERAQIIVLFHRPFRPTSPELSYEIRNIGRTFAKVKDSDCGFGAALDLRQLEYEIKPKPIGDLPTKMIAYPNIPIEMRNRPDIPLPPERAEGIEAGKEFLIVRGYVIYDDVFDVRHITRFCQVYRQAENNRGGGFVITQQIKPEYNEAD